MAAWRRRSSTVHSPQEGEEEGEKIRNGGDRGEVVSLHSQTRRWNTPVG